MSFSRSLRKNPTEAEQTLWVHLRMKQMGGNKFRRQQRLGSYIVDFACLEKQLVVELDGGQHAEQLAYDSARKAWLESQGFRVLRFWNNEVLENIQAVKDAIWKELMAE